MFKKKPFSFLNVQKEYPLVKAETLMKMVQVNKACKFDGKTLMPGDTVEITMPDNPEGWGPVFDYAPEPDKDLLIKWVSVGGLNGLTKKYTYFETPAKKLTSALDEMAVQFATLEYSTKIVSEPPLPPVTPRGPDPKVLEISLMHKAYPELVDRGLIKNRYLDLDDNVRDMAISHMQAWGRRRAWRVRDTPKGKTLSALFPGKKDELTRKALEIRREEMAHLNQAKPVGLSRNGEIWWELEQIERNAEFQELNDLLAQMPDSPV